MASCQVFSPPSTINKVRVLILFGLFGNGGLFLPLPGVDNFIFLFSLRSVSFRGAVKLFMSLLNRRFTVLSGIFSDFCSLVSYPQVFGVKKLRHSRQVFAKL